MEQIETEIKNIEFEFGYVTIETNPDYKGTYVHKLFTNERHRNQGHATRMMQEIIDICEHPIYLRPGDDWGSDLNRLREFYERLGFRWSSVGDRWYPIDYWMVYNYDAG